MAYITKDRCHSCGNEYSVTYGREAIHSSGCILCLRTTNLRKNYGDGEIADSLIFMIEGVETYNFLINHEERVIDYLTSLTDKIAEIVSHQTSEDFAAASLICAYHEDV